MASQTRRHCVLCSVWRRTSWNWTCWRGWTRRTWVSSANTFSAWTQTGRRRRCAGNSRRCRSTKGSRSPGNSSWRPLRELSVSGEQLHEAVSPNWQLSGQAYGQGTGRRLSVLPTLMSARNRHTADIWSDTALTRTNPQPLATAWYIRFVGSKPEA